MVNSVGRKNTPSALQQAGVEERRFRLETLSLEEMTGTTFLRIHSLVENPLSADSTIQLPEETGQCNEGDPAVLCLRPLDWLLTSQTKDPAELAQHLAAITNANETAILNVSDSFATLRLSGPAAPWLLNKVSGLDFQAGKSQATHCAQTKMGHTAVIVHYHPVANGAFAFDLMLDRSVGKYLWSLLIESADHAEELTKKYGDSV